MVSMSSRMVEIADFPSVNLGNTRSLYVYLPPSYHENTGKHYAVLYMHDGMYFQRMKEAVLGICTSPPIGWFPKDGCRRLSSLASQRFPIKD